ncbi:hypothetical protein D3C77_151520 [compost metagenome]|jgi:hypothetical protein
MDLEHARALLAQAEQHRQPPYEPSIFALGGRGYYENPTTDLLAFFLDPAQIHGFGDCFLRALLSCLPGTEQFDTQLRLPPQREVNTVNGNRIDLILHGETWDLLLENKIFHSQVNPFADYEKHAAGLLDEARRQPKFVVLSPSGQSVSNAWTGLSYSKFTTALRTQLSHHTELKPLDKWQVLAGEFLLHLENVTVERAMDSKTIDFIFEHLPQINDLNKLRDKAIEALNSKVLERLADIPGYAPFTRRHNWKNGPALRYACNDWGSWSDVVLYLNCKQSPLRPFVRVYLCDVNDALMQQGREMFTNTTKQPWTEGKSIIGFEWKLASFDEQTVIDEITQKMIVLMQFENEVRPGGAKLKSR